MDENPGKRTRNRILLLRLKAMQVTDQFIVTPKGGNLFVTEKQIGGHKMIVNTSIEDAKNVNRVGIVLALPMVYDGNIRIGDEVILQHNVFRDWFDMKGITRKSNHHLKDNLFSVDEELIFLINRNNKFIAVNQFCFIEPIFEEERWVGKVEQMHIGHVKFGNEKLKNQGVFDGDKIAFAKDSEYTFEIDGERLYRVRTPNILAKIA